LDVLARSTEATSENRAKLNGRCFAYTLFSSSRREVQAREEQEVLAWPQTEALNLVPVHPLIWSPEGSTR
jgi:hypothetical protein